MWKLLPVVRKWNDKWTVGKMVNSEFVPICICENKAAADFLCADTIDEMMK